MRCLVPGESVLLPLWRSEGRASRWPSLVFEPTWCLVYHWNALAPDAVLYRENLLLCRHVWGGTKANVQNGGRCDTVASPNERENWWLVRAVLVTWFISLLYKVNTQKTSDAAWYGRSSSNKNFTLDRCNGAPEQHTGQPVWSYYHRQQREWCLATSVNLAEEGKANRNWLVAGKSKTVLNIIKS